VQRLDEIAPEFVAMAHRIVWCTVATTDPAGRPRSRILHPLWLWDGSELFGWIATGPTPAKSADLGANPNVSCSYWSPSHDTCTAECTTEWAFDDDTRTMVWNLFKDAPPPVGYDPAIIPVWKDGPLSPAFAGLRLDPWRLRVFPGTMLLEGKGDVLSWHR
jgi:hypothetical protein